MGNNILQNNRPELSATQTLPENFHSIGTFDLKNNGPALLQLNVLGFVLFAISAAFFWYLLQLIRPHDAEKGLAIGFTNLNGVVSVLLAVIGMTIVMLILHEAAHGLFFWLFTHDRPKFAFRGAYAYAAAPAWYLPKRQYLLVALAPLVLLSLVGVALMAVIPPDGFTLLLFFLVSNASGAIGDLWVVGWLLRQTKPCYARDEGDAVTLYLTS
jgi:hypothetical protein